MRRLAAILLALALGAALCAAPALADFGFEAGSVGLSFTGPSGEPVFQAGSHPSAMTTTFALDTEESAAEGVVPQGALRNLTVELPPGFAGDPTAVPRCPNAAFAEISGSTKRPNCTPEEALGVAEAEIGVGNGPLTVVDPVYNLPPGPGSVAKLGFVTNAGGVPVTIDIGLSRSAPYHVVVQSVNTSQAALFYGVKLTVWGDPASPEHDHERGECAEEPSMTCPTTTPERPFLTLPTSCPGTPFAASFAATSWLGGGLSTATASSAPISGCGQVGFEPSIAATPTTSAGESPSGLDFDLDLDSPGLVEPGGIAGSDVEKAVVTLPAGVTTNPAVAQGLGGCSLAEFEAAALEGPSCPESSRIGSVEVETPLLEEEVAPGSFVPEVLHGSIFLARQHDNPSDDLLSIYMFIEDPTLGIFIKQAGRVEPDPADGQLTTTFEGLPQFPFSHFHLHFREGSRAPLITPALCGTYQTAAELYPYSAPAAPVTRTASFSVDTGCAADEGVLPGSTSFAAGTRDPAAGTYSPFVLSLSRPDGSRRLRSISTTLPEGLLGRLAGIPYCTDAEIAQAAARGGEGQGALELASPSCPAASQIGTVAVGAGAGPEPLYVAGKAYLAGPYEGAPLSLEIVTPAIAGPFDLGTVAVRTALQVDPFSARITAVSDQIPTILHGLPLDVRSIDIDIDRSGFTLNPTDCSPAAITGTATSPTGAQTPLSSYFQATGCGSLSFRPTLKVDLAGKTKRTGHPALKAVLTYPEKGAYSNVARAQVGLPHAEFLDQGNLNNTCTRPVLLEGRCPASTIYGKAEAWSPLLEAPLRGNVYLVGGFGYKLPALVAELDGQIRVLLVGRIDTDRQHGIRTTFESVPDAPVSRFVLQMKGGRKYGLLINSEDLCRKHQKAGARFVAQDGDVIEARPRITNDCGAGKTKGPQGEG